jgi:putative ABC transport system permease protein
LGNNLHQTGGKVKTDTTLRNLSVSQVNVDYDFLEVYGIQLKEGRNFSRDFSTDAGFAFIINESLARELGLENPIGAQFGFGWYDKDTLGTIIGVTSDFNFNSLHHQINTLCLHIHPDWGYSELSIKVEAAGINEAIEEVRTVWDEIITDRPFDYSFLDEHFEGLYRADQQMSSVVSIIAGLAIIIACLGLFGLASITTQQRIKEIGIRKILGATIPQLFVTLSKNFAFLVMIAFLVAVPATYLLMQEWLAGFAFRIAINPWVFVFSGAIALSVALVTVSYQTIRAATINPVKTLRDE